MNTHGDARRRISLAILAALGATAILGAQQRLPAVAKERAPATRSASPGDAIQVHGHWIIDVHNPDGTLASHHDFQNALLPSGQQLLSYLISKGSSIITWDIRLRANNADATGPCPPSASNDSSCYIVGPGSALPQLMPNAPNVFATGAFTRTAAGALEISGSATAASAQSIGYVESLTEATGLPLSSFSARALDTPIQVAVGQQLFVKVIVSFTATEPPPSGGGGGGGGGGSIDSDGDGIPDSIDGCPLIANVLYNGVQYCPATTYDVGYGRFPPTFAMALVNVHVTAVSAGSIMVATLPGDPAYLEDLYSTAAVQLNGVTAPAVGSVVTVYSTMAGSGILIEPPSTYTPGAVIATAIQVNSAF